MPIFIIKIMCRIYDLINLSLDGDSHFDNPPKMSNKAPLIVINHFFPWHFMISVTTNKVGTSKTAYIKSSIKSIWIKSMTFIKVVLKMSWIKLMVYISLLHIVCTLIIIYSSAHPACCWLKEILNPAEL